MFLAQTGVYTKHSGKKSVNFTPSNIESHPIKTDDTFHTLHSNIYTMNILLSKAV